MNRTQLVKLSMAGLLRLCEYYCLQPIFLTVVLGISHGYLSFSAISNLRCSIVVTQIIGSPLYWINRDMYYAYMALTKQSFGLLITTMTQWWAPTLVRISGDADVSKQMRKTADGRLECSFSDRMVLFANHQVQNELQAYPLGLR